MDIEVDEGTGDDQYLRLLSERLPKLVDQVRPDLIFYQVRAGQGGGRRRVFLFGLRCTARVGHHNEARAKRAENTREIAGAHSRNMDVIFLRQPAVAFGYYAACLLQYFLRLLISGNITSTLLSCLLFTYFRQARGGIFDVWSLLLYLLTVPVCYARGQGGIDPLVHDRLGRLNLTREGLRRRNRLVYQTALARGTPTVITVSRHTESA